MPLKSAEVLRVTDNTNNIYIVWLKTLPKISAQIVEVLGGKFEMLARQPVLGLTITSADSLRVEFELPMLDVCSRPAFEVGRLITKLRAPCLTHK